MSEQIDHPNHYQHPSGVEAIDVCEHLGFNLGNAYKYLSRAGKKGDAATDLRKAAWYLRREANRRGGVRFCASKYLAAMAGRVLAHVEEDGSPMCAMLKGLAHDRTFTPEEMLNIAHLCERRALVSAPTDATAEGS